MAGPWAGSAIGCYADVGSVCPSIERTRAHPQETHFIFPTKIFSLFDIESRQWLYQLYQRLESKLDLANRWSSKDMREAEWLVTQATQS